MHRYFGILTLCGEAGTLPVGGGLLNCLYCSCTTQVDFRIDFNNTGGRRANKKITCGSVSYTELEVAITAAYNAGIIVVVAAGNDGCNTANYTPTNIPASFVVGATQNSLLNGYDSLAEFHGTNGTGNGGTRTGWNISAFAPGRDIRLLWMVDGYYATTSGTSFAAPYIAGIFAVACQATGTLCSTTSTSALYDALRSTGTLNTVVRPDGSPLTDSTSKFIWQQW